MSAKKRGLGRGLDALLSSSKPAPSARTEQPNVSEQDVIVQPTSSELQKLPIEFLHSGKYQPRKDMSEEALEELASSIRSQGIIQPIVVRPVAENSYEIIAGERRWRAAQIAKLDVVPCIIKDVPDEAAVAIALIENIQREDLNAMEEAVALHRLLTEFELTHQQVADAVGKSRTTVTNLLRLNNLNDDVKILLEHGDIEMGHARCLLALEGEAQSDAARLAVAKALTVRETEKLVRSIIEPAPKKETFEKDPDVKQLEQQLAENLGAKVEINYNKKGKGNLVISYTNLEELDGILSRINAENSEH
ncbi:ParB/RepB/Spo0J family partition protein [Pseudoalteromonas sp. SR44-5]|jgi:ParB family chromosome partitioning protein|uniref:Probable chromosome-partitioning protein ParB n=2 Tax=Pseudoalteromonas TaxID=53246 RepID=A0ABY3F8P5_9GAMM|nr:MULTISPECIES: ParB/RepB/Spo0J family partition protein [Pseudoalteromonas]MBB1295495.1 ParB/RepB/Spo0J family partition protein [Pseudoalteromonas sp. SR41-4]MBB1310683.1 ParB/RepB/Spo0J family partition protein [Pseudoalteromonas sp. SR41-8]MBB1334075.1 ParB/RepB/Spo0J family partition protein [Pseudoalteromonas sp. SR41-6]MBB1343186.1 ParB/RepB/Spo0J family partition protein [Pseudoalteromonas sp. SR45-6]MBB1367249.1 ParB/RepB/Spo0J family partition protein [Pseudoalteromonas sp. SR44-5]|tara:strand:- start:7087 stop:8004 length:918 start_codon:yes stop_codon:yes gene_type:complete